MRKSESPGVRSNEAGQAVKNDIEADLVAIAAIESVPAILDIVCRATGLGFAAVARVTEDRWIACKVRDGIGLGLDEGGELDVATTICGEIRDCGKPVVIDEVAADPVYAVHRTPALYGFQSYISVPIRRHDGEFFGTLCALDPRPARLDRPDILAMFGAFADLIAAQLDVEDRLEASQSALLAARETAVIREQFMAVLGHDLRSPLAAIAGGMSLLERRETLSEQGRSIAGMIRASTARAAGLIDDVLDLARGRLGGGLGIEARPGVDLDGLLEDLVVEALAASPDRQIELITGDGLEVSCDPGRMAQLVSNLLGNAIAHGRSDQPVRITAEVAQGTLSIAVANHGDPIPASARAQLFEPFFRESAATPREGLGLGLYIANEIAKAHGGAITFSSDASETEFRFTMPADSG